MNNNLTWDEFMNVDLRIGTIIDVQDFPEARRPAYKLKVDFGEEIGVRQSSAQITEIYSKEDLLGLQVLGVVNFPPKQIGPFMSECLVTGFHTEKGVVLSAMKQALPNGTRLA
jgi:tRNA-binding protein